MIKYVFALMFSVSMMNAQVAQEQETATVKIGDTFEIGKPETHQYKHINFPKANFIIKRGGLANYSKMEGEKVVITEIKKKKNGSLKVKLASVDGDRFFGTHKIVSAEIDDALRSGELEAI